MEATALGVAGIDGRTLALPIASTVLGKGGEYCIQQDRFEIRTFDKGLEFDTLSLSPFLESFGGLLRKFIEGDNEL
jgi:hypothetical protein